MLGTLDVMQYHILADADQEGIDRFIEGDLGNDISNVFAITVDDTHLGCFIEIGVYRIEDGRKFIASDGDVAWAIDSYEKFPDGQWAHTGREVMN